MKLELETYTPSEAEVITKVPQDRVRNWRRAGHLPRQPGHARYTIAELLVQSAMQMLGARGVPPEMAKAYASEIARATFLSMINSPRPFCDKAFSAAKAKVGEVDPAEVAKVTARVEALGGSFDLELFETSRVQKHLMDTAGQTFGTAGLKSPNWLIIWANGEHEFYYDGDDFEDRFFGETVYDDHVQGPVILFCLDAVAHMVLDRLPRPPIKLAEC